MIPLASIDVIVLAAYLGLTTLASLWLARRARTTEEYVHAGSSLPGWVVALSIFASYISSISFLANPGKSLKGDWNPFVFSLMTPIAAGLACVWAVPFFRRSGGLSAYEHFEHRFGPWARIYSVICFLLMQMTRTGMIIYLLALATAPLLGLDLWVTIAGTGVLMIACSMFGGLPAIVWVGVVHSVTLALGPVICLVAIFSATPGGLSTVCEHAWGEGKFSLGSHHWNVGQSTIWVMLAYGLVMNLTNFTVDQGYAQRYLSARDERAARSSVWWGALLYMPVAGLFFFIGTALHVLLVKRPELLPSNIDPVAAPDSVFPWFITSQLPPGLGGLVVAGIFAAALDPSLNSMAVLTLDDVYRRLRSKTSDHEAVWVLRLGTVGWGLASIVAALAMIRAKQVLDVWWELAGVFGGAMLGLFLLARLSRATSRQAQGSVALGVIVILWMTFSSKLAERGWIPQSFDNPLHPFWTAVVGSLVIWGLGAVCGWLRAKSA